MCSFCVPLKSFDVYLFHIIAGLITALPIGVEPCSGSVGRLLPCTEAKLVDGQGNIVLSGSRGELCVRGPQLCLGYLNNEGATAAAFDHEGFLRYVCELFLPSFYLINTAFYNISTPERAMKS